MANSISDNFRFAQLQPFSLAGAGAIIGATSITLKSMTDINGLPLTMVTDFGTIGFGTLEPGSGINEEQICFTGLTNNTNGTVTLTGISNVSFVYPYTKTSGLLKTHAGNTAFIISNTSGFYNELLSKDDDETINGVYTFTASPIVPDPVGSTDAANKEYVLSVVNGGSVSTNAVIQNGTAGETLVAGNPVYLKVADGRWYKAIGTTANTLQNVELGIAQGAGTAGNAITGGVLIAGVDTHQSGGVAGSIGYISNTSTIATTAGTVERAVGNFLSATSFSFNPSYFYLLTAQQKAGLSTSPNTQTITALAAKGDKTTQFDITLTSGTTYRYTFDGTGTDPVINSGTIPIGSIVNINIATATAANNGLFVTTGVGANYFEITNAAGVAENNKVIGIGSLNLGGIYTPSANVKYITVEGNGGGAGSGGITGGASTQSSAGGGGAGAYFKKLILAASLTATYSYAIGVGGYAGTASTDGGNGGTTWFSTSISATGGSGVGTNTAQIGGTGGTATGGDINVTGGGGGGGQANSSNSLHSSGAGGSSVLGGGGAAVTGSSAGTVGGQYGGGASGGSQIAGTGLGALGANGVLIISEYF